MRETAAGASHARAARKASAKLTHPDRDLLAGRRRHQGGPGRLLRRGLAAHGAPHVAGRPLSLVRCPDGIGGQCFFQKHAWQGAEPQHPDQRPIPADSEAEPLLVIDDLDGLIGLVQAGVLEIHPGERRCPTSEQPDLIVMDLDPGEA